ncbi:MAG: hypothetical protein WC873_00350 [Candidatus Gracilibacteria bacterium]
MKILLDKIASVTKNVGLAHEVEISKKILSKEGAILAVEVLEDKKVYNQLELVSGRLSTIKKGDVLAVALGNRRALKGFIGEVPKSLKVGDTIHILNLGGVAGICTSENYREVGHALKVKVLGSIVSESNQSQPLNIGNFVLFGAENSILSSVPLIIVSGTCMNVGKTSMACEVIKHLNRDGHKVYSAKLAGIAALRDTENMKDYGSKKAVSFVDAGHTSTVNNGNRSVTVAKGAINYLSKDRPDFIVIEFGDGVYGEYGVTDILSDVEIQKNILIHIGCAHDPVGAAKLVEICAELGAPLDFLSGPVTDNSVGISFIERKLKIPAINALVYNDQLFKKILNLCLKK